MPGRGTEPGPVLYGECGRHAGVLRHRRERTRMCTECREVQRVAAHRYRVGRIIGGPRLVSTLGLRRRVRALARRGWGQAEIAERLGMSRWAFQKIVNQDETRREVAEKVAALYRELWDREGPNRLVRANAERKGWPGPMDWDDPDDPEGIPVCVIEQAHADALETQNAILARERADRKNEMRRLARRQQQQRDPGQREEGHSRQAGTDRDPGVKVAMAT